MQEERRQHPRYGRGGLELAISRPGIKGILRLNPTTECLDFSRTGLQFSCAKPFKPGDRLVVDLRVYDIELTELTGWVVSVKQLEDGNWCHGVRFCTVDKRMRKPGITRGLLQIEDKLRTTQEFPLQA